MVEQRVDSPSTGVTSEGVGDFAVGDIQYKRILSNGKTFAEAIIIGNDGFFKLGGDFWSHQEDLLDPFYEAQVSVIYAMADPHRSLEYLRTIAKDVSAGATEEMGGVKTTRYSAVADLRKVAGERGAEFPDGRWPDGADFPVEVWVDDTGKVHRLKFLSEPQTTQTWEFYDWGVATNIAAPPSELVRQ